MPDRLRQIYRDSATSLYAIAGGPLKRFVVSTPGTRDVCNKPEVLGFTFVRHLRSAVGRALRHLPAGLGLSRLADRTVGVLHFLRGGLNFGLMEALHSTFGYNRHTASYMTSQRFLKGTRWSIKSDQYRQFSVPDQGTIFIGDCIATGTTMANGLDVLLDQCREEGKSLRGLVVFTIGCGRAEDILEAFHRKAVKAFAGYRHTTLVYLEGRFGLPQPGTTVTLAVPGTDLIRHPALVTPEFELSQYDSLSYPLERCVVYDVGARAFDSQVHLGEVIDYWEALGRSGLSLYEAYKERWPEVEYESLAALRRAKAAVWPGIKSGVVEQLFKRHTARWTDRALREAGTARALAEFCRRRAALLRAALR